MKRREETKLPAAREEGLIVQEMADEVLVYDQKRHRAHCLNETAALVWRALDGKSTAAEVAARVVASVRAPGAAQAATCLSSGQPCTTSPQCCSGLCSGGTCA